MKIFLDTADIESIKRANDTGLLDGITTNPSKVLESGKKFYDVIKEICQIVKGPVSAEAVAVKAEDIVKEAVIIAGIAPNVVIKVPMTHEGLKASFMLKEKGIKVNVTMVFAADQVLLALKTNPTFVSIVISRLDKIGGDVVALINDSVKIKQNYGFNGEILAASIKNRANVIDCMKAGIDIVTLPENIFFDMFNHPQTEYGLREFDVAWDNVKKAGLA
ncbi:MAG TPA: fructose-6-phosphate aldolase [Prolixibacteraceae bacterium]|nr:fructose-6-phosphate aldolase [Prolixibacteraceae bacterium]